MKEVEIYTDGACSGNPGPGGWGAILIYQGRIKELDGGHEYTTNQRMELQAAIEALRALKEPCKVRLYSDSAYMVNCFQQGWYRKWVTNGWKNSNGKDVENRDLWQQLLQLVDLHQIQFIKVKGHADNEWNNRCDELAVNAIPK